MTRGKNGVKERQQATQPYMESTQVELREFPVDVQDYLTQRAITECRPIDAIISDYIKETARLINQTQKSGK